MDSLSLSLTPSLSLDAILKAPYQQAKSNVGEPPE
jgi:hypothetical protein